MNTLQRIVLVVGAIMMVVFLTTVPKVAIVQGTYVWPGTGGTDLRPVPDIYSAAVRFFVIASCIVLLFLSARSNKKK